jgi:PAS domain S-box-containing protein
MKQSIFEQIADEAIMAIIVFRDSGRECTYLNRMAKELLELSDSERVTAGHHSLTLDDLRAEDRPGHTRVLSEDILTHDGLYSDVLIKKSNGHVMVANVGVKSMSNDGEKILLLMIQDTTNQKKMQRDLHAKQQEINKAYVELIEQNRSLKELDQAKDRFLALTTHELRTPLAAIVATAEVLEMKLYESEEQREQFIKTIHEQGLHLMELVNDVLDFAKIRAGKMDLFVENTELEPLISRLTSGFERMALLSKVTLVVEPSVLKLSAWVDILRLKEVVSNVVNNAIKYNRTGGSVHISISQVGRFARVAVKDTGLGIAEDQIQSVFNEFETIGHVAQHHKGTGLGMPISKRLTAAMGGELSLTSVVGKGSVFSIDLPLDRVLDESVYRTRPNRWDDQAA